MYVAEEADELLVSTTATKYFKVTASMIRCLYSSGAIIVGSYPSLINV
jgi:hypothetical protein